MPILTASILKKSYHKNSLFSLDIKHAEDHTKIVMELFVSTVNTSYIPETSSILQNQLPSILNSECFNDDNQPFTAEVGQTEIGHLFEHILLEYLSHFKKLQGFLNPVYNGWTEWNWEKDNMGTFHIVIDAGQKDSDIFIPALQKSVKLLMQVLSNSTLDYSEDKFSKQIDRLSV